MNDIITDFIGKQVSKRLTNNQPIENIHKNCDHNIGECNVITSKQMNHFYKCKKQDCQECKGLIQK